MVVKVGVPGSSRTAFYAYISGSSVLPHTLEPRISSLEAQILDI
jgi:hypothetical protein